MDAINKNVGSSLASDSVPSFKNALSQPLITAHVEAWLNEHGSSLIETRRHIHAHPELSSQEHNTAAYIADTLARVGLSPTFTPTRNGVLCEVGSGERVIALRADIDALPLQDVKELPYSSTVPGVCHGCGHDVHTTVLLGVMRSLAQIADQLPFRVRAVFQPEEEIVEGGSVNMIAAGALEGVSEIYALHCYPHLLAGQVGLRVGALTSAYSHALIKLSGPGGHTSRPHLTVDLANALGRVLADVPSILERRFDIHSGLVVVFGAAQTGTTAPNIIPQEAEARCTLRVQDTEVWKQLPKVLEEVVTQVLAPTGAQSEIEYFPGCPPVVNAPECVSSLDIAARHVLGDSSIHEAPHSMAGEDFSWYVEHVPGAMMRLGTGILGRSMDLHQGDFDVDERAIGYGVKLMIHTVFDAYERLER